LQGGEEVRTETIFGESRKSPFGVLISEGEFSHKVLPKAEVKRLNPYWVQEQIW
jgi:hypothetical protein